MQYQTSTTATLKRLQHFQTFHPCLRNPVLFPSSQPIQGSIHLHEFFLTTPTVLIIYGRLVNEFFVQPIKVKIRMYNTYMNQVTLQLQLSNLEEMNAEMSSTRDQNVVSVYDLRRRNFELGQEVQESLERDREHIHEQNQMTE